MLREVYGISVSDGTIRQNVNPVIGMSGRSNNYEQWQNAVAMGHVNNELWDEKAEYKRRIPRDRPCYPEKLEREILAWTSWGMLLYLVIVARVIKRLEIYELCK